MGEKVVPAFYEGLALGAGMAHIGNIPVLELNHQPIPAFGFLLKRVMDLVLASLLFIINLPLLLIAAAAIKLDSPGRVLYESCRSGRKARNIPCYNLHPILSHP